VGAGAAEFAANLAANLATDTDSEVAGVSSAAAEAHRVAEWHGGFSAGRHELPTLMAQLAFAAASGSVPANKTG